MTLEILHKARKNVYVEREREAGRQTDRRTDAQTEREREREREREKQAGRPTDRGREMTGRLINPLRYFPVCVKV